MKYKLRFDVNIDSSKLLIRDYITNSLGFKKSGADKFINGGSRVTINPNAIKMEIDISLYPLISISGESWLLKQNFLNRFINDWYVSNFKDIVNFKNHKSSFFTSLESFSIDQISILISRYIFPVLLVFLISFLTFTTLTHEVMLGVYQEVLNDLVDPGSFIDDHQLRPMFFEVYSKGDFWFGSLLLSFLGGGFPFALKNIFCLLILRNSNYISKRPLFFLILFFILISIILTPKAGVLLFSFILGLGILINYLVFSWALRNQPYFVKKFK